jgi:catechol-2,3-dioxygenase
LERTGRKRSGIINAHHGPPLNKSLGRRTVRVKHRSREEPMSRIRPLKFVHVVYRTRRFEQMVRWYQAVFDAKVQYENPALAFLAYDGEHHRFAFANLDILKPESSDKDLRGLIGVDHVAYTYSSLSDLLENFGQLKAEGIKPYWCIHHGITVSMYYADPDGNQMEFQIDCFGSNEEANAFMAGPHFAANPIGVEFDPEDWLAKLRAGTAPSKFLTRRTHEPVSPIRGSFAS